MSNCPGTMRHPVKIEPEDIDHMGHVNNSVYLKWIQAAVIAHWERVAPSDAVGEYLWIALKHEITYRRPAFLDDAVFVDVMIEALEGARAKYRNLIKRGEEVLAEVHSHWCCLTASGHKPVRLPRDIARLFFPDEGELRPA